MTTWAEVAGASDTYTAATDSITVYILADYVLADYISDSEAWSVVASVATGWA